MAAIPARSSMAAAVERARPPPIDEKSLSPAVSEYFVPIIWAAAPWTAFNKT
jgi:hypothetical protein